MMACGEFYLSIGTVIIDDIILPDGESRMARLGGGAVHAVMGMRLWSERVGLAAPIGRDFTDEQIGKLAKLFDLQGVKKRSIKTPRCWELFEADGKRSEVFRTDLSQMINGLIQTHEYPEAYWQAKGIHLHCAAEEVPTWVKFLRSKGSPVILWEPWDPVMIPENEELFRQNASIVDVVSPNLDEGRLMTGKKDPQDVLRALLDLDARCVALRMGSMGSLIGDSEGRRLWVPGYASEPIVDVTGAGNAYCGGFVVGLARTGDLLHAGCCGTVSASFALQQFGALYDPTNLHEEIESRFEAVFSQTPNPRRFAFDLLAEVWDEIAATHIDKLPKMQRIVGEGISKPDQSILDIGTGTGGLLPVIKEHEPRFVLGIDLSMVMLKKAIRKYPDMADHELSVAQADALLLPLKSSMFDVVFCHGVFPHLFDTSTALKDMWRVLVPGGRIVISHAIGRERVNAIHSHHTSAILRDDLLPSGEELVNILERNGWVVFSCEDKENFYLVSASKPVEQNY